MVASSEPITIRLKPHDTRPRQTQYTCRLAGQLIQLDSLPRELAPFLVQTGIRPAPAEALPPPTVPDVPPYAQMRGLINNVVREITCWRVEDGCRVAIEHGGVFSIDAAGTRIVHLSAGEAGLDRGAVVIGMIGAALALALAQRGVYVLHGAAMLREGGAVLFLGDSGAGKSTLSGYLHAAGWQRLGDDGMPITVSDADVLALPHYPQLKLGREAQIAADAPAAHPVRAVYQLDASDDGAEPAIVPLTPSEAARALIFHSAAVSLLPPEMLMAHAAAMARIAAGVAIKRLVYPHRREVMQGVRELLAKELTSHD